MVVGEKFVFDEAYEEVGVARSHFCSHCNTVNLFGKVSTGHKLGRRRPWSFSLSTRLFSLAISPTAIAIFELISVSRDVELVSVEPVGEGVHDLKLSVPDCEGRWGLGTVRHDIGLLEADCQSKLPAGSGQLVDYALKTYLTVGC